MSRDPLAPLGDAFDASLDEMGATIGLILILVFVLTVVAVSQAVVEYQRRKSQPGIGIWEEPTDSSDLWWPDAGLNLGEVVQWE